MLTLINHKLVDEEIYLHSESDPRYKGSVIPSKAFKCLQIMTDGAPNNIQSGMMSFSLILMVFPKTFS